MRQKRIWGQSRHPTFFIFFSKREREAKLDLSTLNLGLCFKPLTGSRIRHSSLQATGGQLCGSACSNHLRRELICLMRRKTLTTPPRDRHSQLAMLIAPLGNGSPCCGSTEMRACLITIIRDRKPDGSSFSCLFHGRPGASFFQGTWGRR